MTTYVQSFPTLAAVPSENLSVVELRVISNLLQREMGNSAQGDDLARLRNDQGFELGIPGTIPGN